MKRDDLVVTRDWLVKASLIAGSVIEDEDQPDDLRADAADVEFMLSEVLLHQSHSADGERSIRLLPIGFKWAQFYTQMVDEFVLDLPAEVREDMPVHILMARMAAKYTDDGLYSSDFRLDAYDALNTILAALKAAAADDEDVAEEVPT
jgi:hypothetical protein